MEKKKILVVDDQESFCRLVELNLEETGEYEVRTETKGTKALDSVREFRPDLILLDIMMPDVSGEDVAQRIRSDVTTKDIPIVFLTALVKKNEVADRGGIIGEYPFLAKPVTAEKLIDCIERNIRK